VREYRNGAAVLGKSTLGYEDTGLRPDSIDHLDRVNAEVDTSTYGWDDAYNLESVAITGGVLAASPESYDYDPLNRLDPDSPDFDPAWTYDDTGNRTGTGYTQTGQDAGMHRYTTVDGNAMHYDAQGALVQAGIDADSIYEYTYDVKGRLISFRDVTVAPSTAFDPLNLSDAGWNTPLSGAWSVNDNGTSGNASDDYLEETSGTIGALFYEPNVSNGGMTFAYRSPHDLDNPDGDGQPGEFDGDDHRAKYYAQVLFAVADDPGPPFGYCALRIEPDRLSFVAFDGTELKELDTVDAVTEANTWYNVRLGFVMGGPEAGTLVVERTSPNSGDPVVKLMQATSLSELPEINGSRIGFTVGAAAEYQFKLVEYADYPSTAETYIHWDYDAYGRKIAESVYDGSTLSAQTRYVWDGWRLISEINGLTGQPIAEYIPGPDYVDDVVATRRDLDSNGTFAADEVFYHQTNHQHSTVALLDHNGDVAERYSYDPFGVPTVHDAAGDPIAQSAYGNKRLYTGLPWLPDLGLYDTRQRLYNPAAGRFLTQDPAHDPANLGNPYTYVGNNPGAYVDPYGEDAIDLIVTGQWNPDVNTWEQAYGGFGLGAAEGQTVIANAATLGLNSKLNAQAQSIKADARARGDVVSQIGFGLGEVGVEAGYAAVGGHATKGALTSGRGTAFVIRHATGVRRATQAASVVAAGAGGYSVGNAAVALSEGDYERTIHRLGSAALSFSGAGFGAKTAPGKLGSGPLRIGSVAPPENVAPGTTTFGNKMHEKIGTFLQGRFGGLEGNQKIIYRLGPGQRGVDIEVPENRVRQFGFRLSDIKPQSPSGVVSLERQLSRWGYAPGEVVPLTYRASGDIYIGF
jgi:RHS repeat-associated protein